MLGLGQKWPPRHSLDSEYAARAVTEWIRSCHKRQAKLISYIWFTMDHRQHRVVSDMVGLQVGTVSNFLDVREVNHSVSQRCRSRGNFTGCRRNTGRHTSSQFLVLQVACFGATFHPLNPCNGNRSQDSFSNQSTNNHSPATSHSDSCFSNVDQSCSSVSLLKTTKQ